MRLTWRQIRLDAQTDLPVAIKSNQDAAAIQDSLPYTDTYRGHRLLVCGRCCPPLLNGT